MFNDDYYKDENRPKEVPIPFFTSAIANFPVFFGEDPGHVSDDFDEDEYEKLTR